jgi:hypothetical protein
MYVLTLNLHTAKIPKVSYQMGRPGKQQNYVTLHTRHKTNMCIRNVNSSHPTTDKTV